MYNRYIPQPDGSYRRNRVQSPDHREPPRRPPPPKSESAAVIPPCSEGGLPTHSGEQNCPRQNTGSIPGFFRNLLPKDMDTGDLLIILLLLLMAGDNEKERNNALLTIALYFFM